MMNRKIKDGSSIMKMKYPRIIPTLIALFAVVLLSCSSSTSRKYNYSYFIRFKVIKPTSQNLKVVINGYRHESDPWNFSPIEKDAAAGNHWSEWIDLSKWDWHGKVFRSGGIAEYPSISLTVADTATGRRVEGCKFEVQLADSPADEGVVITFSEQSGSDTINFLAPYPLRKNAGEFETATQMIQRQTQWAKEAVGEKPIKLEKFDIISNLWNMNNPSLEEKSVSLLHSLGFNVINNVKPPLLQKYGIKTYEKLWLYQPDPETVLAGWEKTVSSLQKSSASAEDGETLDKIAFWEISDEVSVLNFSNVDKKKLDGWFYDYLKKTDYQNKKSVKKAAPPTPPLEYPLVEISNDILPKTASLEKRKLFYQAAKFGQWWSAKQLKQVNNLILEAQPDAVTSTLLPSHGFFGNAWGPSKIGMSYGMLDIFELAEQDSVNQLAVEDWMGLNHMYGPEYTWTGGQSFGYYNAIVRSAIGDKPIKIQGFITPSDDKYLRLKAYSALGQGAKSFYFWSYGPTYVSTENYWSDLQSQYIGLAKLNRSLEKAEEILYPAKTVADESVEILYSVSHDIWNNDNQAAFVEKRLLWHALRHLQIQPNFLREDDIEAGKLEKYKVLYITDWNITRRASEKIDKWIKNGGTLYLSAGAATRDEFNGHYTPKFAENIWIENPTQKIKYEKSTFNERTILPNIKPLTAVNVEINGKKFNLPAIGVRLDLNQNLKSFAKFEDGKNAGAVIPYGKGQIIAVGFMPMLGYGKLADFKPKTLEEKWKSEPREIIKKSLELAKIDAVIKTNIPVIETNLLNGINGSAIVLANYTYQPVKALIIDVKIPNPVKIAESVEGNNVKIVKQSEGKITLETSLDWTDIIILK